MGWPGCPRVVHLSPRLRLLVRLPVPTPRLPHVVWLDVFFPFRCYFVSVLLAPVRDSTSSSSSLGLHPLFLSGGMRRPKNAYYIPLPLPSSLFLLSPCLLLLFFAFLFSPFSSPRAGCGALNTHLAPFVFFSLFLLVFFPFLSFLLSPGGLRRPKYASRPLFLFLFLSFSLSLSFFLSFFFSSLFSNYFLLFLFARLGMACSWCRSSTSRCFSTRFRRVSGLFGVLCPRR